MPELSEVANTDQYLKLLVKSELLEEEQLRQARKLAQESPSCKMLARRLIAKGLLTRWQASQLLVGWYRLRIGKYSLSDQIGRGELGRVFLAEHRQMGRQVAIKTLSRRFTRKPEAVDRFLAEARDVAALDHRNILHVYDIDQDGDQFFLVTEYVDGNDLQRLVEDRGPLPVEMAIDYIRQSATALGYAHELGMVHRGVRPANLMVDHSGTLKVLGLGVGILADAPHSGDEPSSDCSFRAPEQIDGAGPVDQRTDLYSLGCVMYFLLTGKSPGDASSHSDDSTDRQATPPIASLREDVPADIISVCSKLMAVDPNARYKSADALVAVLEHWLEQRAECTPPAKAPPRRVETSGSAVPAFDWVPSDGESKTPGRTPRRSSWWEETSRATKLMLATSVVLFIAAVSTAVFVYMMGRDGGERPRQQPRAEGRRDTSHAETSDHLTVAMAKKSNAKGEKSAAGRQPDDSGDESADVGEKEDSPSDADVANTERAMPDVAPPGDDAQEGAKPEEPADKQAPTEEPQPTAPAADADKPAEQPKTEPVKPPPPKNPFLELEAAIELPAPTDTEPFSLGSLVIDAATPLTLSLLGGNEVIREPTRFQLDPTREADKQAWRVLLIGDKENADREQVVAQVSVLDEQLTFQWVADAEKIPLANQLCNCVLRCASKDHTHDLRMRTPMELDALKMSLLKSSISKSYRLPDLPDSAIIKLQVIALNEPFPAHSLKPAEAIEADDGKVSILLGESADEQVVTLEIETQVKRTLVVKCSAFFQLVPGTKPEPLTNSKFQSATNQVMRNQRAMYENVQRIRAINQKVPRDDPKKKRAENELKIAEAHLEKAAGVTQKFEILSELRQNLKDGGLIHLRLFHTVDGCEVELLKTVNP